jgi:hypothetical protein
VILYHRTPAGAAILAGGFRDGHGNYLTINEYSGVWLSNSPLDANEGATGDDLLAVEIPEEAIAEYEWVQDFPDYREWLVPGEIVNRYPVRQVDED